MSPLLTFILIFSISCFAQLHYKAGKRIKALEAKLEALEKDFSESMDSSIEIAKTVNDLAVIVSGYDRELIHIRSRLKMEKPNGGTE